MSKSKTLIPSKSKVTTRDDKGRQFVEKVEAVYNKAGLSEDEAQCVNEAEGLNALISQFIAANRHPNEFADEETESNYGYLSGYNADPGLEENLQDLDRELAKFRAVFPELAKSDYDRGFVERIRKGEIKKSSESERWMLVPRSSKLAPVWNNALQRVLDAIKKDRQGKFWNYRGNQTGPERLQQTERSLEFWQKTGEEQTGDILVVTVQLGKRHAGKSVRRARVICQSVGYEVGLDPFAVGIAVLTHPERLNNHDDLWIDCPGAKYDDPASGVRFGRAPCFSFRGGRVRFGAFDVGNVSDGYGSASVFLPQSSDPRELNS